MNTAKKARKALRTKISQAISVVLKENCGADPDKVAKAARKASRKLAQKFMPTCKFVQPAAEGKVAPDASQEKKKSEKKVGKKQKEVLSAAPAESTAARLVS